MSLKVKIKKFFEQQKVKYSDKGYRKYFTDEKRSSVNSQLSSEQVKEIKSFYRNYFKPNPLFHTFYTEKTGSFCSNYIPDDIWFTSIDRHFNNREKAKVLDHKSYYERMFMNSGVKFPQNILERINGFWFNEHGVIISFEEALEIIKREDSLFVKLSIGSCGGRGVIHLSREDVILEKFKKFVKDGQDVVVQRAIKQHEVLGKVGKTSVNTLRIISLLNVNEVKIYSSCLRMGIGESKVDNASSGGIITGVQPNGQLKNCAYTMFGVKYDSHPTTGQLFSEVIIPSYEEVIKEIKRLHPMIPDFRLVSWDFAIDQNEQPILIEVNLCMGGLDFHQLCNGPVFGEDTKKILDEVFLNK